MSSRPEEGPSGVLELSEDGPEDGVDAALLRRAEPDRHAEAGELEQSASDPLESALEGGGQRRLGGGGGGLEDSAGVTEEAPSVFWVGDAVCLEECDRGPFAEGVLLNRIEDGLLILLGEGAEDVGGGGPDGAGGELLFAGSAEVLVDVEPRGHPPGRLREGTGNGGLGEPVVVFERSDNLAFVERGERPRWSVGEEDETLVVLGGALGFDDDRDLRVAFVAPGREALEAVEDLVAVAADGNHADGQRRQERRWFLGVPWAKLGVARPQLLDRQDGEGGRTAPLFPVGHRGAPLVGVRTGSAQGP